jgi:hypothetical protein
MLMGPHGEVPDPHQNTARLDEYTSEARERLDLASERRPKGERRSSLLPGHRFAGIASSVGFLAGITLTVAVVAVIFLLPFVLA